MFGGNNNVFVLIISDLTRPPSPVTITTPPRKVKGQSARLLLPNTADGEQLYGVMIDATKNDDNNKNYDSLVDSGGQYNAHGETKSRESALDESGEKARLLPDRAGKSSVLDVEIEIDLDNQRTDNISVTEPHNEIGTDDHSHVDVNNNSSGTGRTREHIPIVSENHQIKLEHGADAHSPSVKNGTVRLSNRDQKKAGGSGQLEQGGGGMDQKDQQRATSHRSKVVGIGRPDQGSGDVDHQKGQQQKATDRGHQDIISAKLRERLMDYCNPPSQPVQGSEGRTLGTCTGYPCKI